MIKNIIIAILILVTFQVGNMISAGQEKNIKKLFTSKTHLNSPQNIDSMKNDDNTGSGYKYEDSNIYSLFND